MKNRYFAYCLAAAAAVLLTLVAFSSASAARADCTLDDFYWYIEGVKQNGIPRDAAIITDKSKISGAWKCFVEVDPQDQRQSAAVQYAFVNIAVQGDEIKFNLNPLRIKFAREASFHDLSRQADSIYRGRWENGGIYVTGPGNIRIKKFYSHNGRQYAIGEGLLPDGCLENYALVRP